MSKPTSVRLVSAAAPEMLAALERLIECADVTLRAGTADYADAALAFARALAAARAAVAKARGEEP